MALKNMNNFGKHGIEHYGPEGDTLSIQDKSVQRIECKYCGCVDYPHVSPHPTHGFRVDCAHCGKFHKWGGKEYKMSFTREELIEKLKHHESEAIRFAKQGNGKEVFYHLNKRDKYNEQL